jgi:hypothetical protein
MNFSRFSPDLEFRAGDRRDCGAQFKKPGWQADNAWWPLQAQPPSGAAAPRESMP